MFCNHLNTSAHRFCGMCGKALPDPARKIAKQLAPPVEQSGTHAPLRGIGGGPRLEPDIPARPIAPIPLRPSQADLPLGAPEAELPAPPIARSVAALHSAPLRNDPHRDLSYLLEEDHVAPKPSRLPWIVGGLLLAAMVGFFAMRSGGKPPASSTVDENSTLEAATPSTGTPGKQGHPPAVTPKIREKPAPVAESKAPENALPDAAPADADPDETSSAPAEPRPVSRTRLRTHAAVKTPPKAYTRPVPEARRKPSPAQPTAEEAATPAASVDASSNCNGVPALRRAADRGDVKARTSLGLVYYSGQCVPRDLPTAYHWYALALRANPDSQQLSAQLEAIWKQMSPAERQIAIRPQP